MSGWHKRPLMAFDTETTGVDPVEARIVTATVLTIDPPNRITEKHWLINPGVPIPAEATAVHGITDEQVQADGEDPRVAVAQIAVAVSLAVRAGVPLIAYNACYDLTVLDHELARYGHRSLLEQCGGRVRPVIDPLVIDRGVDRYRKGKRTLTAACEHYGVRLDGAHDASADAVAAARVAYMLAVRYPDTVGQVDPEELHDLQVEWQGVWAEHFQDYLRTRGDQPDAVIDPSWPYRPAVRDVEVPA